MGWRRRGPGTAVAAPVAAGTVAGRRWSPWGCSDAGTGWCRAARRCRLLAGREQCPLEALSRSSRLGAARLRPATALRKIFRSLAAPLLQQAPDIPLLSIVPDSGVSLAAGVHDLVELGFLNGLPIRATAPSAGLFRQGWRTQQAAQFPLHLSARGIEDVALASGLGPCSS
jgi:hypothetical protein